MADSLTFQREALTGALLEELLPLLDAASREVHGGAFVPGACDYAALEAAGRYAAWTARRAGDGALVGVCGMVITPHPHLGVLSASQDVLYLAAVARSLGAAGGFLRAVDAGLLEMGAAFVYRAAPSGSGLDALYGRAGYRAAETIHVRSLSPWAKTT